jgi:hypothetical protein
MRKGEEIPKQLKAGALAFLRVELCGEDVLVRDGGGEGLAVYGLGGDDGRLGRLWEIAVNEIEMSAIGDAAKERTIRLGDRDLVPTNLGNLETRTRLEADDGTGEDAKAGSAAVEFGAAFEQGLISDANAEKRAA